MGLTGLYNATMTTQRSTTSKNSIGEEVEDFANKLIGMRCRLAQLDSTELEKTGSQAVVSTHKIWFDLGLDIVANDEVIIGGATYSILSVDPDVSGARSHGSAQLRRVD